MRNGLTRNATTSLGRKWKKEKKLTLEMRALDNVLNTVSWATVLFRNLPVSRDRSLTFLAGPFAGGSVNNKECIMAAIAL